MALFKTSSNYWLSWVITIFLVSLILTLCQQFRWSHSKIFRLFYFLSWTQNVHTLSTLNWRLNQIWETALSPNRMECLILRIQLTVWVYKVHKCLGYNLRCSTLPLQQIMWSGPPRVLRSQYRMGTTFSCILYRLANMRSALKRHKYSSQQPGSATKRRI